ncbi:hypothetical protein NX059_009233 [Plenodomus lindquistii]|nr:hypothetical protein NX059_009233 [Plenodomus lindquistii]
MSNFYQSSSFTFRCPPPRHEPQAPSGFSTLCSECEALDLEHSFIAAHELYEGARRGHNSRSLTACRKKDTDPVYLKNFHFVTSLGNRLSFASQCRLCNFFAATVPEPRSGCYKIMAICSSESHLFEPRKKDIRGQLTRRPWEARRFDTTEAETKAMSLEHNVFMALVPELPTIPKNAIPVRWFETDLPRIGAIYRATGRENTVHRLVAPRQLSSRVDFTVLRAWLCRCRSHHFSCTRRPQSDTSLAGFKVIDCRSLSSPPKIVERPWSERYVALSYVWGPPSGDWPQTVSDAIEVTKQMGERYLWVDRTCIDQTNLEEKLAVISKMDAIYAGAEFTIVCAAGDARSGLPGVMATPRKAQPQVQLEQRSEKSRGKCAVNFIQGSVSELLGVTEDEYATECLGERKWLDDGRFGLGDRVSFNFRELLEDRRLQTKYDIPQSHLKFFREMAEDFGHEKLEDFLELQLELARRIGIPLKGMVSYLSGELAASQGLDPTDLADLPIMEKSFTDPSKPMRPLARNRRDGTLTLLSTMQDPRWAIKQSTWATRGWTYQEGVLSNRRLVFTEEQVYWECHGMAICESLDLALDLIHEASGERMADFMLSGIFDDDLHHDSELQYGFQPPKIEHIGDQVVTLDGHIEAYTSRNLTDGCDTLRAFMGVANTYTTDNGLCLLLGIPAWAGSCANGNSGLQHTFALSVSSWTHTDATRGRAQGMLTTSCARRSQFPSWTWAGWEGAIEFCNEVQTKTRHVASSDQGMGMIMTLPGPGPRFTGHGNEFETAATDPNHSDFFKALTSKDWVSQMDYTWSAAMTLHSEDGSISTTLTDGVSMRAIANPELPWRLTIKKPLLLRHMNFTRGQHPGEWRRLDGRVVGVHLSVPITDQQLVSDQKSGHLRVVLVFASMIPFVYNGIARYLILRQAEQKGCWERIGRLNMWITEKEMERCRSPDALVSVLPVCELQGTLTIV